MWLFREILVNFAAFYCFHSFVNLSYCVLFLKRITSLALKGCAPNHPLIWAVSETVFELHTILSGARNIVSSPTNPN